MPLKEEDIHIIGKHLSISRWEHHNKKGENILELTLRLYNAVTHSHKNDNPVWQQSFNYSSIKTMIDFGREINIGFLLNQPLVLTYEEDHGKEIELKIPIGKPYEILIVYDEHPVGPAPAKRSVWDWMKGTVPQTQKAECVMEIQIPYIPSGGQIPNDLLGCQLDLKGNVYNLHLPGLKEGKNTICYYNPDVSVNKGSFEIRNDLKNFFKIVYR